MFLPAPAAAQQSTQQPVFFLQSTGAELPIRFVQRLGLIVVPIWPALVERNRQSAEYFKQQFFFIGFSRTPARTWCRVNGNDEISLLVHFEEASQSGLQKPVPQRIARDGRDTLSQKPATQSLVNLPRRIRAAGT